MQLTDIFTKIFWNLHIILFFKPNNIPIGFLITGGEVYNMNWYKKAVLINKQHNREGIIILQCCYCDRWASHPFDPFAPSDQWVWKTEDQVGEQEREIIDHKELRGVSHGMCPRCSKIVEEIGMKDLQEGKRRSLNEDNNS